jgi:hypothetical protein
MPFFASITIVIARNQVRKGMCEPWKIVPTGGREAVFAGGLGAGKREGPLVIALSLAGDLRYLVIAAYWTADAIRTAPSG